MENIRIKTTKHYTIQEDGTLKKFHSKDLNYVFNKKTGFHAQWGKTKEENPERSHYGPIIADIEVVSMCKGPGGKLCPFCFPSGTLITTPSGYKKIEDIKVGDNVLSVNTKLFTYSENEVKELYSRYVEEDLICIEMNDKKIFTTSNHPFFVKDIGWITADNLTEDMVLISDMDIHENYLL